LRPDAPAPGMVTDQVEVARFAAERDQDARGERWLIVGQAAMLLIVIVVTALLLAVQGT
jgi:hypothetical protein